MKIQSPHPTLTKVLTGIQGFDEITDGGLPGRRTTFVLGGPGCGKTVFALQALLRKMRHADEDVRVAKGTGANGAAENGDRGTP
jgi:circadian clock protein KaiC